MKLLKVDWFFTVMGFQNLYHSRKNWFEYLSTHVDFFLIFGCFKVGIKNFGHKFWIAQCRLHSQDPPDSVSFHWILLPSKDHLKTSSSLENDCGHPCLTNDTVAKGPVSCPLCNTQHSNPLYSSLMMFTIFSVKPRFFRDRWLLANYPQRI